MKPLSAVYLADTEEHTRNVLSDSCTHKLRVVDICCVSCSGCLRDARLFAPVGSETLELNLHCMVHHFSQLSHASLHSGILGGSISSSIPKKELKVVVKVTTVMLFTKYEGYYVVH